MASLNQIKPPKGFVLDTQQEPPTGFVLDTPKPPKGFVLDRKIEAIPPKPKFDIRAFLPMQYPKEFAERYFPAEEKVVQRLQRFIEPKEQEAAFEIMGKPFPKEFPRYLASELISLYRPSRLVAFGVAGKALGVAAKGITRITPAPVRRVLGRAFKYRYAQPPAYQVAAEKAALKKMVGAEEATKVSKILSTSRAGKPLTPSQQRYVGRLFREEVAVTPRLLARPEFREYQTIAKEGRAIMDKWSGELVKSGVPSKEASRVIEENIGRYMPRMFAPRLLERPIGFPRKPLRLKLAGLKHRKDLSADVLRRLGEIKEPALPTAIRVRELAATSANAELFNTVSRNPEWSSGVLRAGWTKMPNTPSMGALKNKWVIPEIANDINGLVAARSQAIRIYDKALSAWKFGKVVLNPATHARNIMSNTMLTDFYGLNHFQQARLLPRVASDYIRKGKFYQDAKGGGLLGTEFYSVEASQFLNSYNLTPAEGHLSRIMNVLKMPLKKAGEVYQFEEQLFKMMIFTDMRMKGAGVGQAVKVAEKWIFNYQKIPKFIEFTRRFGSPFVTFCVSVDTQILTNNGWKFFDEVQKTDKTLGYDIKTENLKWQDIEKVFLFPYSGKMKYIKSRSLDILMTPNHRNVIERILHRRKTGNKKEKIIVEAKRLTHADSIIVAGNYQAPKNKVVDDDMVRLIGWFITEGYIVSVSRAFCIGQTNEQGQKEIEALRIRLKVDKFNIQKRRYKLGGYKLHKVYYFPAKIRDKVLKLAPNKELQVEFLSQLTKEQLQILYETILLADGCNFGGREVIVQNPSKTADAIQILGVLLGKQVGWCKHQDGLSLTFTKGKKRQIKRNMPQSINYNGFVWCPKTPSTTWVARRNGKVFITGNTYKAIPRLAETAVNNPLKLYKYYAFANAFNDASAKQIGLTEEEMAQEVKYMPEWMKTKIPGMPTQLLMPAKDEYGRTQYLNLEYILPVGMAPEVAERGIMRGLITNPALTAFTEIKSNKDFRGKEIYSRTDTTGEKNIKIAEYLFRQLMPSFAPGLPGIKGGYSWEKAKAALEQRGDYLGRLRTPEQVMLDIFVGLKIQPVSVAEGIRFEAYEKREDIQKALMKLKSTLRHKGISKEEKERVRKETIEKLKRIRAR